MSARGFVAAAGLMGIVLALAACGASDVSRGSARPTSEAARGLTPDQLAFLDTLQHRTFRWFWDDTDPATGLTPDRSPTESFCSVGAVGFGLTALPIGAERGWVSRAAAADRARVTLRTLWRAPQDSSSLGAAGYRGFFYHFLDRRTGLRFATDVELSTIDTALLIAGALSCRAYFGGRDAAEAEIRALADSLADRVDWRWAQVRPPTISHGWSPEAGFLPYDWRGYNEAMLLNVLALGSRTHAAEGDVWGGWTRGYRWGTFEGQEHLGFAPLFGHQYTHVWIDFRGIHDAFTREKGIDYFENSRRATLAQRAYAIRNPQGWDGYGAELWGLTACDGPADTTLELAGRRRELHTYMARGASFTEVRDDGTLSPAAAGGSLPFAPEVAVPALMALRERFGERVFTRHGFVDAFNPSLRRAIRLRHGVVDPQLGWFDIDHLGIDQGPILAMAENLRTEQIWTLMRRDPNVVRGLRRAGFSGGWLDQAPPKP